MKIMIMSSFPFCTGRPPGPEMENAVNRESYSLAAGLALGLVMLEVPQSIVISKLRVRNVQGPVSRKSRISGDIIVFVALKRRRLEARNFSSYFNFYSLYNISKTQLYRGPKSFRDFRETGSMTALDEMHVS